MSPFFIEFRHSTNNESILLEPYCQYGQIVGISQSGIYFEVNEAF